MKAKETDNRILIVAYDFPPVTSAGMYRITRMAKHLIQRGWNVTVVSVKKSHVLQSQASLRFVPDGTRVFRTQSFELYRFLNLLLGKASVNGSVQYGVQLGGPTRGGGIGKKLRQLVSKPYKWLVSIINFPDTKVGWFLPLFFRTWKLLQSEKYKTVISSSPPHSSHLPMLLLRRMFNFQWIAEFRDPWTAPHRGSANPLSVSIRRSLEGAVLRRCDRIIANTPGNKEALHQAFPSIPDEKVVVITNGFDSPDAVDHQTPGALLDCDLVFVGNLYEGMLDPYMDAVCILRERGEKELPVLHIYGKNPSMETAARIKDDDLEHYICFKGRVSYEESFQIIQRAPALLLLLPHEERFRSWVPSKLYAYLFSPAPVLAILPLGDASQIVEKTGRGVVVSDPRTERVADELAAFLDSLRSGSLKLNVNSDELLQYSWDRLSSRLDTVISQRREVS